MRAEQGSRVVSDPAIANPEPPIAFVEKALDLDFVLVGGVSIDVIGGKDGAWKDQGIILDPAGMVAVPSPNAIPL
jgi:hypothetical protein